MMLISAKEARRVMNGGLTDYEIECDVANKIQENAKSGMSCVRIFTRDALPTKLVNTLEDLGYQVEYSVHSNYWEKEDRHIVYKIIW